MLLFFLSFGAKYRRLIVLIRSESTNDHTVKTADHRLVTKHEYRKIVLLGYLEYVLNN